MEIHELPKIVRRKAKRVGRGYGSGKGGHTVGRGQKGQKARSKIHPLFTGTKIKKSLLKRLPLQRGKGKLKPSPKAYIPVSVGKLDHLPSGTRVDEEALIKHNIIRIPISKRPTKQSLRIKIIDGGTLSKKLTVSLPTSKGAAQKIEKAGGKVDLKAQ